MLVGANKPLTRKDKWTCVNKCSWSCIVLQKDTFQKIKKKKMIFPKSSMSGKLFVEMMSLSKRVFTKADKKFTGHWRAKTKTTKKRNYSNETGETPAKTFDVPTLIPEVKFKKCWKITKTLGMLVGASKPLTREDKWSGVNQCFWA